MRQIDLRDSILPAPSASDSGHGEGGLEEQRAYLVLAADTTYKFHAEGGNRIPWRDLKGLLEARLPGGGNDGLYDISVGPADVALDGRLGEDTIAFIATEIVSRGVMPPSARVTLLHASGVNEELGPLGEVARHRAPAFA